MPRVILRFPAVEKRTGVPLSTTYHYMRLGIFPKQVRLGARSVGWYADEIDEWIESRQSQKSSHVTDE